MCIMHLNQNSWFVRFDSVRCTLALERVVLIRFAMEKWKKSQNWIKKICQNRISAHSVMKSCHCLIWTHSTVSSFTELKENTFPAVIYCECERDAKWKTCEFAVSSGANKLRVQHVPIDFHFLVSALVCNDKIKHQTITSSRHRNNNNWWCNSTNDIAATTF